MRSARRFEPDSLPAFGHRCRVLQMGYDYQGFMGKPVIGIIESFNEGHAIIGLYPPTQQETETHFAAWRAANGKPPVA